ncbi:hypothetical protein ROZALSC1DRAFT_23081, partial [Rozella allomycis CSF55]
MLAPCNHEAYYHVFDQYGGKYYNTKFAISQMLEFLTVQAKDFLENIYRDPINGFCIFGMLDTLSQSVILRFLWSDSPLPISFINKWRRDPSVALNASLKTLNRLKII